MTNEATKRGDIYTRITDQITALLEAGVKPWTQPWNAGHAAGAPYDVILIGGGVAEIPGSLKLQLADGGRLVAIVRDGPVGRGVVVERVGTAFGAVEQFDAVTPILPGFEKRASFVF